VVKNFPPLALLPLAALIGAVGIGPRRKEHPPETAEERPRASAPAASPGPVRVAPLGPAPAPAPINPAAGGRVRIERREGIENQPRRHYWHGSGRGRYSHYYDGRVHWYGYAYRAGFFWMRPYGGLWWTWDARFSRWSYWHDGFWWWPGPAGVHYVYIDDGYYPYDTFRRAPPPTATSAEGSGDWSSPDGRRLVEVSGPESEALLYDKTTATPSYIRFLGKDVRAVRFSNGPPPTIFVEFRGGGSALFDLDGRRLDRAAPAEVKEPPPPSDVPPAPADELPPPR